MDRRYEPIWWLPLLRRVVRWGVVAALVVNLLPTLVVACFFYRGSFSNMSIAAETEIWDSIVQSLVFASIVTCPFALLGAITGWASGFCAPPNEPTNPLKSGFLHIATAQTFGFWLVLCVFVGAGLVGVYAVFFNKPPAYWRLTPILICGVLAIAFALFMLSLWRGINRARRATKLK